MKAARRKTGTQRQNRPDPLRIGLARNIITPPPGVALAGYFSPRFNRGVHDDLQVRVCLFQQGGTMAGIVHFDLLEIPRWFYGKLRQRVNEVHGGLGENLVIAATHTHTGPEMRAARDALHQHALDLIIDQAEAAVRTALWRFVPVEMQAISVVNNPLAFNRRYWMKSGKVVTNPGKLNPEIVGPEGPVDRQIHALLFSRDGHPVAVIANLSNHTDTIGDDLVSADWPGFLERALQAVLGSQIPVITLVGAAGNINHFDVSSAQGQTCYAEARRIGEAYAEILLRSFEDAEAVPPSDLSVGHTTFRLHKRAIAPADLRQARLLVEASDEATGIFTSEDLARGAPAVLRFFAEELIAFAEREAGTTVDFPVTAIRLGADTALVSVPGEPFAEIGMAIRGASPFKRTLVASNANGYAGYIVLDESFERGGYEPLPVADGGADKGMAQALQACAVEALRKAAT